MYEKNYVYLVGIAILNSRYASNGVRTLGSNKISLIIFKLIIRREKALTIMHLLIVRSYLNFINVNGHQTCFFSILYYYYMRSRNVSNENDIKHMKQQLTIKFLPFITQEACKRRMLYKIPCKLLHRTPYDGIEYNIIDTVPIFITCYTFNSFYCN